MAQFTAQSMSAELGAPRDKHVAREHAQSTEILFATTENQMARALFESAVGYVSLPTAQSIVM